MKVNYENIKLLENLQKTYEKLTKFYPEDTLFRDYLKKVNSSIAKLKKESIIKNQF
ncbi:hypothetical protein LCGC14_2829200 [marine sediment metagenome]|uniref:FAS1 domain-containing protein n=1 Tax=marine sediment metagenome TaxID=412755 RepID=A0A0F9AN46_9ZZZZ